MRKAFVLVLLVVICFIMVSCDTLSTDSNASTTTNSSETTSSIGVTSQITLDEEDTLDSELVEDETVTFAVSSISSTTNQVLIEDNKVIISTAGTYLLQGVSNNVSIYIDVSSNEQVTLLLDDVHLTSLDGPVIEVENADKVILNLVEGTSNSLTDSKSSLTDFKATISSNDDVTINGSGSLSIYANYKNGISSDDDLVITNGVIIIDAANNGVKVNNDVFITNVDLTISCLNDGIQVENTDEETLGNLVIENGEFDIDAYGDCFDVTNVIAISEGVFLLHSGDGNYDINSVSGKGMKASQGINILGGTYTILSSDDGLHSNSDLYIQGGIISISSNDDGIHSDETLVISGGEINISKCYEGLESLNITINGGSIHINGGSIHINASDDGINVAGGSDSSSSFPFDPRLESSENAILTINGGYVYVISSGDGIDANGQIIMTGGVVLVNGPTSDGDGPIDYNVSFKITGGILIATGSSGMAQNVGATSTQPGILIKLSSETTNLIHLEDELGNTILHFQPVKKYESIVISCPLLEIGDAYKLYLGGSLVENTLNEDGYSLEGVYQKGTLLQSFTLTSLTYSIGTSSFDPRR
ncbi:MAG: carbohydrate-binding domain-containing protein [Firmicutes bacterium]|nr:carbohydrate-binding domain-containing protein [Bacillota bacterium]